MRMSLERKQGSTYLPVQEAAILLLRGSIYSLCDLCVRTYDIQNKFLGAAGGILQLLHLL